jgi:hypothetical protein
VAAVLVRIGRSPSAIPTVRTWSTLLAVATPIGMAVFALVGPLEKGWARRAGTPLPKRATPVRVSRTVPAGPLDRAFSAPVSGTVAQTNAAGGAIVELSLRLGGSVPGQMRIRLGGSALPDGGLSLTGSQVDLTAPGMPSALGGKVTSLSGDNIRARVSDVSGAAVDLQVNLSIDQSTGAVSGNVTGTPVGGGR